MLLETLDTQPYGMIVGPSDIDNDEYPIFVIFK
jgi:hypothetical protein